MIKKKIRLKKIKDMVDLLWKDPGNKDKLNKKKNQK